MPELLHVGATVQCFHGAPASAPTGAQRVKLSGDPLWTVDVTPSVTACPFTLPNGVRQPCVTVRWTAGATRIKAGGRAVVLRNSPSQCLSAAQIPQGVASVAAAQHRAVGT